MTNENTIAATPDQAGSAETARNLLTGVVRRALTSASFQEALFKPFALNGEFDLAMKTAFGLAGWRSQLPTATALRFFRPAVETPQAFLIMPEDGAHTITVVLPAARPFAINRIGASGVTPSTPNGTDGKCLGDP